MIRLAATSLPLCQTSQHHARGEVHVAAQHEYAWVGGQAPHHLVEGGLVRGPPLEVVLLASDEVRRLRPRRVERLGACDVGLDVEERRSQRLEERVEDAGHEQRRRRDHDEQLPPVGEGSLRQLGVHRGAQEFGRAVPGAGVEGPAGPRVQHDEPVQRAVEPEVERDLGHRSEAGQAEQLIERVLMGGRRCRRIVEQCSGCVEGAACPAGRRCRPSPATSAPHRARPRRRGSPIRPSRPCRRARRRPRRGRRLPGWYALGMRKTSGVLPQAWNAQ